jgi:diguanylate cyclase (GGDEF)-like protein
MTDFIHHPFEPFVENRRSFVLLRWLLIVLIAYLVLVSRGEAGNGAIVAVGAFFLSNLVLALLPESALGFVRSRNILQGLDAFFVSISIYMLRVEGPPIHLAYIAIFLVALVGANPRVVMFSLVASSILFGAFSYFGTYGFGSDVSVGDFMALSLLLAVAIFYVFLSNRFDRDSATATVMLEERRNSAIMVEVTRTLAASMNADDIYRVVVSNLSVAMPEILFEAVRIGANEAFVEASSEEGAGGAVPLDLDSLPLLRRAWREKKTVSGDGDGDGDGAGSSEVAVPMITQGEVIGLIRCRAGSIDTSPHSPAIHLFEVIASTAANALRNVRLLDEMKHMARTDFLTGLPNHRYFRQTLHTEMGRAQRHQRPMSLLVVDLDFLKSVNDRFGHPAGDAVIRSVAETIRATCRRIDFAARYGGEEFIVILPDTDLTGAVDVAERLRAHIMETDVGNVGQVTASVGVANYPVNALTEEDLVRVADQALYVAKNGGRNQVAHFKYELTNQ